MQNIWSTEAWAIVIAACTLALLGTITGEWFIACLLTLGCYIAWLYQRMLKLEQWIRKGTRASEVYDDRGFVGIIIRQLHEQKKTNNRRKRRTKRILRRLKQNIAALPDATVMLNHDYQIEWCNEPASYLLNLRSPQDRGYKINNLIRDPAFLSYLQDPSARQYIEFDSPVDPGIRIQVKLVAMSAKQFLLIARNVSDQKLLQESLKNFVANASHELKSPLTVISGHLEMLEAENKLSDSGKHSLHTAQRQAERMKELIQGLLLLSQVESYNLAADEGERVPITELMINMMAALDKYADKSRIQLEYPEGLLLLGINIELEGICINLAENALKYTTPGTAIIIKWEITHRDEYVFSVQDQGPGIEADDVSRLTRRYYRGAKSRADTSGSGLGLAIVQHAATKHGATFKIDTAATIGSRFSVTFPSYRCIWQQSETPGTVNLTDR